MAGRLSRVEAASRLAPTLAETFLSLVFERRLPDARFFGFRIPRLSQCATSGDNNGTISTAQRLCTNGSLRMSMTKLTERSC